MPTKNCPYCAEPILEQAIKCKHCGEMLSPTLRTASETRQTDSGSPLLRILGLLLFVGGLGSAIYYYVFFDTSVVVPTSTVLGQTFGGDRVNNIGLLQDRQNGLLVSIVIGLVGFVCAILGERLKSN